MTQVSGFLIAFSIKKEGPGVRAMFDARLLGFVVSRAGLAFEEMGMCCVSGHRYLLAMRNVSLVKRDESFAISCLKRWQCVKMNAGFRVRARVRGKTRRTTQQCTNLTH